MTDRNVIGNSQRRTRTRAAEHAARKGKGDPKKQARKRRAYDRGGTLPENMGPRDDQR